MLSLNPIYKLSYKLLSQGNRKCYGYMTVHNIIIFNLSKLNSYKLFLI